MSGNEQVRLYVNQFLANVNVDDQKANEVSLKITDLIQSGSLKLIELVKALGDYLTAEDDLLRPKATACLSASIKNLPSSSLNQNDIQVLSTFFINKASDLKATKEAFIGLSALIEKENFGTSNIKPILELFEDYDSKHHLASCRYFTFEIFDKLLTKFHKYIQRFLNDLYVENFIHIASGEKDPRNLLISFSLNHKITSANFKIEEFQDELFDILFCYFPISFKPPKDDPYHITSDQLKDTLRKAIASTPLFAKDSYPNLLEKISSTSPTVKKDTIQTITACIENYGHDSLVEHWVELWSGLKFEILHGDQDDDEHSFFPLVLNCFKAIGKILSTDEQHFVAFFNKLSQELNPNIKNHKHIKQTISIFASIASSSVLAFNTVTNSTLLLLLNDEKDLNVAKQRTLISNIGIFTDAYIEVFGTFDDQKESAKESSLLVFKDEILIILGKALMGSSKVEVSLRTIAIAELTKITTLVDFLADSELSLIVQYFTESILVDDNEYIYNSGIGGLVQISKINTPILLEVTFPTLLSLLPDDESKDVSINGEEKPKEKIFEIINSISINKEITHFLIFKLFIKLKEVGSKENNAKYSYAIASTMKTILENSQAAKQFSTDAYLKELFSELAELVINAETDFIRENKNSSLYDNNVIDVVTDVIKLIVVYSSKGLHQGLVDSTLDLFYNSSYIQKPYYPNLSSYNVTKDPQKSVHLLNKILAGVDKSVRFVPPFFGELIGLLELRGNDLGGDFIKIGYLQLVSLLVNKWIADVSQFETRALNSRADIEIYTWIAKGVILKSDPRSEIFIDRLLDLLSTEEHGSIATKSFEILVTDLSIFDKFKKINNNNVRLLYKQKFIQLLIPKLVSKFQSSESLTTKSNYLTALSYVLKHSKREIIIPHLSSFFPLLLQSLSLPNSEVRFASVQTILSAVDEIPELISRHLQTLIPNLLKLSQVDDEKLNNQNVRLVSLNCLQGLTFSVALEKLVPYQIEIIRTLEKVLDDKKRSVRKGAVDARQAYYELGRSVD